MAEQNAKITEEQLNEIKETQGKVNQILNQIGFVEIQKSALKVEFSKENEKAEEVKKKLEEEYGPINIDLQTGEYTIVEVEDKK
jgi:predicted nuclease with TOPRIM domain|tara:strand:- start:3402 stop:3653 length:252 start_codon:yes stop_codon:yes gene_type:complete